MTTILQILPAEGWVARYQDGDGFIYTPVAAFALVEADDGQRSVKPLDAASMGFDGLCSDIKEYAGVEYVGVDAVLELKALSHDRCTPREALPDTPEGSTLRVIPFKKKDDDE
ncbi:hypothetical protein ACUN9V_05680 [Salinicola sp. V024]|uniref:hypothetical protein n=1 Tax=Salinicola sp. V024 TaxID=3459609 RepID=UPI004043D79B